MVTGQKAFQGTSKLSTLSAILHQEPKPVSGIAPTIPADLEKLINRCLRKDPERRWQAMADLKVALQELKEDSDSGRLQAIPSAARQLTRKRVVTGIVTVVALMAGAVAAWYWLNRQRPTEPEAPLAAVPLTSYPGTELNPSFSPDGTQVAFQWCTGGTLLGGEGRDCDIYVKQIGEESPQRLTTDPAEDHSPVWSPDARFIAFLRQLSAIKAAIVLIPQRGGKERVLGESDVTTLSPLWGPYLAWTPDSKWLVFTCTDSTTPVPGLFLLSVETLEKRRLTSSPHDGVADSCPAVSPDGRTLAFTRSTGGRYDIYVLRLGANYEPQGVPERLAGGEGKGRSAAAWTPDGSEIIFAGGGVWRVVPFASEKPRKLALESQNVPAVAISRQGNRLAYVDAKWGVNIWRVDLLGPDRKPGVPFRLIPSTRAEAHPAYSPDGRRITFDSNRSGHPEIWLSDSDGSNPVQLTSFGGPTVQSPRWSPDGRNVVFHVAAGRSDIYVISASGGLPRRLTTGPSGGSWPCWSRDSRSIYFQSSGQVWKMPASGGEPAQITRNGGGVPQESPDGKFIYYIRDWPSPCSVWRMPVGGGEETRMLESVHLAGHYTVGAEGIYFFGPEDDKGRSDIIFFYDFVARKTSRILTIDNPVYEGLEISPDGRTILYPMMEEPGSDLMLVENFH
jgi:Tol biopolymer transport system component